MNLFKETVNQLNNLFSNRYAIVKEEPQNAAYGGGIIQDGHEEIRIRVAKVTPVKIGQFVAMWEKDDQQQNQPFSIDNSPAYLMIIVHHPNQASGCFIFPRAALEKHQLYSTSNVKGKMGLRVYLPWDQPDNRTVKRTQTWQVPYFYEWNDALHFKAYNEK